MIDENTASVLYKDKRAGTLRKTVTGFEFVYVSSYLEDPNAAPISLSMPLRPEKYESNILFPFFDGLLPEGWFLDVVSSKLKVDKHDKFKLLLHMGRDPIGAVSVMPFDEAAHV